MYVCARLSEPEISVYFALFAVTELPLALRNNAVF